MWTRRLLLLTLAAAAAMSLPHRLPASWNVGMGTSTVASSSLR